MRFLKFFYAFPILMGNLLIISGCYEASGPQNEFVQTVELDTTTHPHSTTRQFQRMVFFADNQWFVFYSDGADCLYKVSIDGVSWSTPHIMDKGIGGSSNIDVTYRDNLFYYFNSLDVNPDPDKRKMALFAQKGSVGDQHIEWGEKYRVFKNDDSDYNFMYSSVSMDPDGILWAASRHWSHSGHFHDVVVSRTLQPFNITSWSPGMASLKTNDPKSLAPQIIGLGAGKAYLTGKATEKGKIFGNFYDGVRWDNKDQMVGESTTVGGDDKRMSMVYEPGNESSTGRVHLVYIDDKDHVRYRVLSVPDGVPNWTPPLDQSGELVVKDSKGRPINAFSCILSIDSSEQPALIYLLYGETKWRGKDPRAIRGELRLTRNADGIWSNRSLLMSEYGEKHNIYPNMNENTDKKIGILYTKVRNDQRIIMFSSADKRDVDNFFNKAR